MVGSRGVIRSRGMIRGRGIMDNRGSIRGKGSMVGSSVMDRGGMVDGSSMVGSSMVDRGGMVGSRGISSTIGNSSRCMYSCSILLSIMISINSLRSSMRLANYGCYTSKVRFKYRGRYRRSISKLDGLMVRLITSC